MAPRANNQRVVKTKTGSEGEMARASSFPTSACNDFIASVTVREGAETFKSLSKDYQIFYLNEIIGWIRYTLPTDLSAYERNREF